MNPWVVLPALILIAAVFVVGPVAATTFAHWRRPWRLACPREGREAQIKVAPGQAALAAVLGRPGPGIHRCSLWSTVQDCREECLDLPVDALRRMRLGEAPPHVTSGPGLKTIVVPLDGSAQSETVLDAVAELARAQQATVRLVHVVKPVDTGWIEKNGRVVTYVDQECERAEHRTRAYLNELAGRLPGVRIETAVRFGDPLAEIVDEAESASADLIAMARHRRGGLGQLLRRSLARRLERETTIPLLVVPYGERDAA